MGPGDRIGIFRGGDWVIDSNGSHSYEPACDEQFSYGQAGDIPVVGDWMGSGSVDVGVYRGGLWILDTDHDRVMTDCDTRFTLGDGNHLPVVGRWTFGAPVRFGLYTPALGRFWLDLNGDRMVQTAEQFDFAGADQRPVTGDWNGDETTGVGVFVGAEPNNAYWTLDRNEDHAYAPATDVGISFGLKFDLPATGDWEGRGRDSIGVFRDGTWTLERDINGNPGDPGNWITVTFGGPGDVPVVMRR